MTLADVAHAEGAVRQDAENSAHYRPVRFAAGHHDHHLAGGVQEDPASPAASNHRRMNFPLHFDYYNFFFFQFLIGLKKNGISYYRNWWRISNRARLYSTRMTAKKNNDVGVDHFSIWISYLVLCFCQNGGWGIFHLVEWFILYCIVLHEMLYTPFIM